MTRKFIPCIYLYQEKAVKDFTDFTVIHEDPVAQARLYSEKNSDELIVFDLSAPGDDTAHDKALDIIKDICASVEVDVIGSGNIKRMEDVKKLRTLLQEVEAPLETINEQLLLDVVKELVITKKGEMSVTVLGNLTFQEQL